MWCAWHSRRTQRGKQVPSHHHDQTPPGLCHPKSSTVFPGPTPLLVLQCLLRAAHSSRASVIPAGPCQLSGRPLQPCCSTRPDKVFFIISCFSHYCDKIPDEGKIGKGKEWCWEQQRGSVGAAGGDKRQRAAAGTTLFLHLGPIS